METNGLHDRLKIVAGDRTYRHLSELTGTHHETVRRYMQGQSPGVEYLTALCVALGISAEWLLTGTGPMRRADVKAHALGEANASDLLGAMAGSIEKLIDRVQRIERFVQALEMRFRAAEPVGATGGAASSPGAAGSGGAPTLEVKGPKNAPEGAMGGEVQAAVQPGASARVRGVVENLPGRSRPPAG